MVFESSFEQGTFQTREDSFLTLSGTEAPQGNEVSVPTIELVPSACRSI